MKKHKKIMISILFISLFTLFSCDDSIYYKTFDYKTMTFVEQINQKTNNCIRFISQTDNKIEMEVFFENNRIKRTFIKKEGYWYSNYKYKTVEVPGYGLTYGKKFEIEYYIYKDHLVYKKDGFIFYIDLIKEELYLFKGYKGEYKNVKIDDIKDKLWKIIDYYTEDDILFERNKHYNNGVFDEEIVSGLYDYPPNINIFYWLDLEIYYPGAGVEPVYD
jgi:hypothetical protein